MGHEATVGQERTFVAASQRSDPERVRTDHRAVNNLPRPDIRRNHLQMNAQGQISSPQVEKDFRAFLKAQGLLLKTLNLAGALAATTQFRATAVAYPVLEPGGDGLAFDAHLGTMDRCQI